jgi:hypothetical protein
LGTLNPHWLEIDGSINNTASQNPVIIHLHRDSYVVWKTNTVFIQKVQNIQKIVQQYMFPGVSV